MKIQILGTGCKKCETLYANAQKAIGELNLDAELVKVTDITEIIKLGVMMTPALAIDGKVKSSGKLLSAEDIKEMLTK